MQAGLLSSSQDRIRGFIDNLIPLEQLDFTNLPHKLKILILRDAYTITAIDGNDVV